MKNQTQLIITAMAMTIIIILICLWTFGLFFSNGKIVTEESAVNDTSELKITCGTSQESTLPDLKIIQALQAQLGFSKWECDPIKKELTLYAYDIQNESVIKNIQGKQIDNYTIRVIHDTEFEIRRTEVYNQLWKLRLNPDYQLARISMVTDAFGDPPGNYAELWVYNLTPENKNLDNTSIQGWKILVYPMAPLPSNTGYAPKSVSSK